SRWVCASASGGCAIASIERCCAIARRSTASSPRTACRAWTCARGRRETAWRARRSMDRPRARALDARLLARAAPLPRQRALELGRGRAPVDALAGAGRAQPALRAPGRLQRLRDRAGEAALLLVQLRRLPRPWRRRHGTAADGRQVDLRQRPGGDL